MEETSISQALTQLATMQFGRCGSVAFGTFYGLHLWQRGELFEPVKSTNFLHFGNAKSTTPLVFENVVCPLSTNFAPFSGQKQTLVVPWVRFICI
jgi:hypothetical protein